MKPKALSGKVMACYQRVYDIVAAIPHGKVMTYGQIARLAADGCAGPVPAIQVGRAMAASAFLAPDLPWWRVIGLEVTHGILRKRSLMLEQKHLLAREGIIADDAGRYDLRRYLYTPPGDA